MVFDWILGIIATDIFWTAVCCFAVFFIALVVFGRWVEKHPHRTQTQKLLGGAYAAEQMRAEIAQAEEHRAATDAYRRGYLEALREAREQTRA